MPGEGSIRLEESCKRIAKLCRFGSVVLGVLFGISLATGLLTIVVSFAGLLNEGAFFEPSSLMSILPLLMLWATTSLGLWVVFSTCKDMAKGTSPFTKKQARRLRLLGTLLLISVFVEVIASPELGLFVNVGDIDVSTETGNMSRYPTISINALALVFGILSLGFSLAFDYGSLLQKLSDETV